MSSTSRTLLLDDEGAITQQEMQFEQILKHIFAKYCTPPASDKSDTGLLGPPTGAVLTAEGLDKWATDTNGKPLPDEQKDEIKEFMDVDEHGNLTFKGFMQIYQLQTEGDEEETWKDLVRPVL